MGSTQPASLGGNIPIDVLLRTGIQIPMIKIPFFVVVLCILLNDDGIH